MKRILLLVFAILFSWNTYAQSENGHLTFKGIPISGSLESFVAKLENKGYKVVGYSGSDFCLMKGFFEKEFCEIGIRASEKGDNVFQVSVIFPKSSSWSSLKSKYYEYKNALSAKYGKPISEETFFSPYSEGDGREITAICEEKCTYASAYILDNGGQHIILSVVPKLVQSHTVHLCIQYEVVALVQEDDKYKPKYNDL